MNFILSIPMEARVAVVFVLGIFLGGAANWAIYRLAWHRRSISPWSRPEPSAPPRRPWDRLPIIGWLGLRRESRLHGACFWVRPMLLELFAGIGLAWLYWWEVGAAGLLPPNIVRPIPLDLQAELTFQFLAHRVLLVLMLAASMIDVDEKIIPDEITIPGTLLGLLMAAACPLSLLPYMSKMNQCVPLLLTSPSEWPSWLDGTSHAGSLALPRTWYSRHGWPRALQLAWTRLVREPATYRILRMALMGAVAIALVWYRGEQGWRGLLTAMVGMAAGGGLVWAVRVIGSAALQQEAMGFGDVILMAMLGAFLGWQSCLVIFFLAPLAGLMVGVLRLILFRDKEVPYGPFLCLAALFLIVRWDVVWQFTQDYFALGWLLALVMVFCLLLMAGMLGTWRLIRGAFR
jgi:prepilin signal peptidase PulO-like enzyme (type II secretory pathway)